MRFISIKEAAEKWKISERLVQRYCNEGRVEGAVKFSGIWQIPENALKPGKNSEKAVKNNGVKTNEIISEERTKLKSEKPMPLINTPFKPGHCIEEIVQIEDTKYRNLALAEYYYFSGKSEKAAEITKDFLSSEDIMLKLSACWIFGYSNLALNRIEDARKALFIIRTTVESIDENSSEEEKAFALCVAKGATVLLHLPLPEELPPLGQFLNLLPPGMRLFALYIQAHYAYLEKQYGASLGVVETALSLQNEVYPIPMIYLHLVATMDYMSLKMVEKAKEHFLAAWELARPDDLIEGFGEHHGLLGGMVEAVIKKEYPDDFKRIISVTYSFSAGWRKIHNSETGEDIADNLSTTEFASAMLASRGWSNKEIGEHLGISANTVKQHISDAMQKLGIKQRKDLAKFMLK